LSGRRSSHTNPTIMHSAERYGGRFSRRGSLRRASSDPASRAISDNNPMKLLLGA